jgi:hypothetical protein
MNNARLRREMLRWWKRQEAAQWEFGVIGRTNTDESVTVDSPAGTGYVIVKSDKGTYVDVWNRGPGHVPPQAGVRVRYREEYGRKVMGGIDTSGPMDDNPNEPAAIYSVNGQTGYVELDFTDLGDVPTTYVGQAGKVVKVNGAENALEFDTEAGDIAGSITAASTGDTIADADLWGYVTGGVLVKTAWSNIKAVLKTYFDTLYTFAAIVADNSITNAKLRDSGPLSVIGRTANTTGDPGDISATAASGAVLRESGSTVGFGTVATAGVADDAVTFAKMQNIATDSLIGRDTASSGDPENILLNATLSMDGAGNLQRAALTGDVTALAGSNATAIGANKVLTTMIADAQIILAKMADLAADRIIGRANGAGTGVPTALTAAQVATIIQASIDHNVLTNLTAGDVHTHYALLAGRAGGQTFKSDTASGGNMTLMSTAHATKGKLLFGASGYDEANDRLGIGASDPASQLEVTTSSTAATRGFVTGQHNNSAAAALFYFQKSRNTRASPNTVANGDFGGVFYWQFHDGTNYLATAAIAAKANGTVATGSIPTNLIFSVGATDDLALANQRMILSSAGLNILAALDVDTTLNVDGASTLAGNVTVTGDLMKLAGTSSNDAKAGGVLYVTTAATGNVGTGQDDIAVYSVPANTLAANNQSLWFEACGTLAANGNSKEIRVHFGTSGTSQIADYPVTINNAQWVIRGRIWRTGAATQKAYATILGFNLGASDGRLVTTLNQTLSGAVSLRITGEAVSNNDIVCEAFTVGFDDANT